MHAIAAQALPRISACGSQDLATILWAVASMTLRNTPLRDSIAAASRPTLRGLDQPFTMLLDGLGGCDFRGWSASIVRFVICRASCCLSMSG